MLHRWWLRLLGHGHWKRLLHRWHVPELLLLQGQVLWRGQLTWRQRIRWDLLASRPTHERGGRKRR
jgi:hypothetical protein